MYNIGSTKCLIESDSDFVVYLSFKYAVTPLGMGTSPDFVVYLSFKYAVTPLGLGTSPNQVLAATLTLY